MLNPLPQESWSRRNATHLLQRAGYGGSPEEQKAFYQLGKEQGIEAAVDSLLETSEDWSSLPINFRLNPRNQASLISGG